MGDELKTVSAGIAIVMAASPPLIAPSSAADGVDCNGGNREGQ